jgi:hypothetical protein
MRRDRRGWCRCFACWIQCAEGHAGGFKEMVAPVRLQLVLSVIHAKQKEVLVYFDVLL